VTVTGIYFASLIQAIIRDPHDQKTQGHKITDSVFFIMVRIQDFMLSIMITVIFYRIGWKKMRSDKGYKRNLEFKVDSIVNRQH
jgi:hypothetical protein